ncbi:hypothetical protein [Cryobacterium sp. Hb1]|uniref:hypothetical protein n=1 Tax=Cryobacterium sp. Hb1 TaxID=1259147 RepID=UPI00106ABCD1|nr:hypothetical protein [Cryobacterium sp. Hb1]TFD63766.1 hypothetical protein E3T38_16485 [Cryobacterium sp. Hb1]
MALHPIGLVPHVIAELPSLQGRSMTVGDYLPRGHVSYARVMNPMHDDDGQPLAWRTFAAEQSGVDATTKWTDLNVGAREVNRTIGTIEPGVAATLARLLRAHTSAPTECFFLIWEGYAGMRDDLRDTASIKILPGRKVLILAGDVADGAEPFDGMAGGRSAQWWMPADGVWAVGNDLYGASVYVSGTEELITAILAADDIEAYRATASMQIVSEEWAS